MSIYFLRHVKTYNNLNEILSGRHESNILPNQIIQLPKHNITFDIVYSSTSKRCRYTLGILPSELFISDVIYTDNLLERSLGILENLPKSHAIVTFPDLFVNGRISVNSTIPNGETLNDVILRVQSLTDLIMSIDKTKQCLICSHNQTLKIMYALIKRINITDEYWKRMDFTPGNIVKIL